MELGRVCGPGFEPVNLTQCRPCLAGTFKSTLGSAPCTLCSIESYQPSTGQYACLKCPRNAACNATDYTCSPGFVPFVGQQCIQQRVTLVDQSTQNMVLFSSILVTSAVLFFLIGALCGFKWKDVRPKFRQQIETWSAVYTGSYQTSFGTMTDATRQTSLQLTQTSLTLQFPTSS